VPVLRAQPEFRVRNCLSQRVRVRLRNNPVTYALNNKNRLADRVEFHTPRAHKRAIVIDQPAHAELFGRRYVFAQARPCSLQGCVVPVDEAPGIELRRLLMAGALVPAEQRRTQAGVVGHARKPVFDGYVVSDIHREWGNSSEGCCCRHPVGERRGAGQGMRSTARRAHHCAVTDAQGVQQLFRVGGAGRDRATDLRGRAAVPRTSEGD
jgi:hypothetical protein